MRKHGRRDANHRVVSLVFSLYGWSVEDTADLGGGFPDLVVSKDGETWVVEIKDGDKPPSKRRLTDAEEKFKASWQGTWVLVEDPNTLTEYLKYRMGCDGAGGDTAGSVAVYHPATKQLPQSCDDRIREQVTCQTSQGCDS